MADITADLVGVSVPANTSADMTVYEDVGNDGSGASTDPNGTAYDNSASTSLADGVVSYTLSGFSGGSGNAYWIRFEASNTDDVSTVEVTVPVTLTLPSAASGSVLSFSSGSLDTSGGVITTQ